MRGQVYDRIKVKPGINYTELRNELGLRNGILTYHISVLERQGFVRAGSDGYLKRFYPLNVKVPENGGIKYSELQTNILNMVKESPGISQTGLAQRLGMRHSVINYNIKRLRMAGVLRVEQVERETRLYASKELDEN